MPRTDLTVQQMGRLTVLSNPTRHTPDNVNGNSFDNSGFNVFLYVTNSNASSRTLTVTVPSTFEGEPLADKVYTIATNTRKVIGPFSSDYNQTDNGLSNRVLLDWSAATDVTVEVISMPNANDGI